MDRRGAEDRLGRHPAASRRAKPIRGHGIGPHRAGYILEALLAQIGELDRYLASDLIVGRRRDADAAGFRDALKPRRDVDAVPEDVVALDQDVTEVDPDPEEHTLVFRDILVPLVPSRLCTAPQHSTASTTDGKLKQARRPPCSSRGVHRASPQAHR